MSSLSIRVGPSGPHPVRRPSAAMPLNRQAAFRVTKLAHASPWAPSRYRPEIAAARCRRSLRCFSRLTSSRDSLDEEQQPREVLPVRPQQSDGQAAVQPSAASLPANAQGLLSQQQREPFERAGHPRRLTIKELQRLTELHVENAYSCGVVSSAAELAECLGTCLQDGLCESQAELAQRAQRYGCNSVRQPKEVALWELILEALQDFTILVLLGAGCLSLLLESLVNQQSGGEGSWIEGASILAAVSVVVLVTAVNNYQKERQFRALQAVSADVKVRAIRGGRETAIPVQEVLVGDVLLIESGDILCTDGLLLAGNDVKVDESHLTGESDDVAKDPRSRSSLLGGSRVLSGFGRMLVTAVGPHSQSGAIAEMVADGRIPHAAPTSSSGDSISSSNNGNSSSATVGGDGLREETLLQRKLATYATSIGRFGLGAAVLAFVAMSGRFSVDTFLLQQQPWDWAYLQSYLHFFITGVTILVVAVPEGLPLAVTLALAFSVRRMLADNNLVRHLSAAETMGTATVVCSDKTGTLTQNNMVVSRLWLAGKLVPDVKPYTQHESEPKPWQLRRLADGAADGDGSNDSQNGSGKSSGSTEGSRSGTTGGSTRSSSTISGGSVDGPLLPLQQVLSNEPSLASLANPSGSLLEDGGSKSDGSTSVASSSGTGGSASSASFLSRSGGAASVAADGVQLLVESAALNSTANIVREKDGTTRQIGNRTEVALLELALLLGASPRRLRDQHRQLAQVAFSSERKRMTTACSVAGASARPDAPTPCRIYTKGAAEVVLERCRFVLGPDGTRRLLQEEEKRELVAGFGEGAQRVLCLAYRDVTLPPGVLQAGPVSTQPASAAENSTGNMDGSRQDGGIPARSVKVGSNKTGTQRGDHATPGNGTPQPGAASGPNPVTLTDEKAAATSWDESLCLADNLERDLTLLALVGIEDPLRTEVPAAIRQCQASGIAVKMLTGDNVATATTIARECGILPPAGAIMEGLYISSSAVQGSTTGSGKAARGSTSGSSSVSEGSATTRQKAAFSSMMSTPTSKVPGLGRDLGGLPEGAVMEGAEFRRRVLNADGSINADEFLSIWPRLRVMARCTPADKYTLVTGARSLTQEVVAVTGDGTNDAPALRAAHVGFAMNSGTGTAREAADIVLLDDNFTSIVSAVLWGRNVYANITRFMQFQLTVNLVAVATAVTGAVVAAESPLTAVQMLWVNMIMDSLASLALATEPPDPSLLHSPPFSQDHEFVDPHSPTVKHIVGQAAYQLLVMYGLIFFAPTVLGIPDHSSVAGPSEHYTLVFNTFVFMQLFNQLNARKILDSTQAWEGLGQARWFQWMLGSELLLQILIVQFGGEWFHTTPLNAREWTVSVGLGAASLLLREVLRRLPHGRSSSLGS